MNARSAAPADPSDPLVMADAALAAARGGRGRVVVVTGENGIGKTRLAGQIAERGERAGMCVLRGRASAVGPAVPFRPLAEALLGAARLRAGDLDGAVGPYRRVLGRLIPDWSDGSPPQPASVIVLAEGVLRLTAAAGNGHGCVMILDDLQDADAETLAVTEYLCDNVSSQPILLVLLMRERPGPALDMAMSAVQRGCGGVLRLERLSRAALPAFVAERLGCDPADLPSEAVERLWSASGGHPMVAAELLRDGVLRPSPIGWRLADRSRSGAPTTLGRVMAGKVDRLPLRVRATLCTAAVFGDRFPLDVVAMAAGVTPATILSHVDAAGEVVELDPAEPGWGRFLHPLAPQAILARCPQPERAVLAARAADAIESVYVGLPDPWCHLAASLRLDAGDRVRAAGLFADAARRAQTGGATASAAALFELALDVLDGSAAPALRDGIAAEHIVALADDGQVDQAIARLGALDTPSGSPARIRRAALHTHLAWAANLTGRHDDGLAQVAAARAVLPPDATDEHTAPLDGVNAQLIAEHPNRASYATARRLAERAAAAAERIPLPDVASHAWRLIGALTRHEDVEAATACFERARALAVAHRLPEAGVRALTHLGGDDSMRDGTITRLERARDEAQRMGAVLQSYIAESAIALQLVLFGDYAEAAEICERLWPSVVRLRLPETAQYIAVTRAALAAHQGRRADMDRALSHLRQWGGDRSQYPPLALGLARAWCALLEEDRPRALSELDRADRWEDEHSPHYQLTGRYGLGVLLRVLEGRAGHGDRDGAAAASAGGARWNRQFLELARAVLAGRDGDRAAAETAMASAFAASEIYRTARHLGSRLVAGEALAYGWGDPVGWLRDAEAYFFGLGVTAVASACRATLRSAGAPIYQRRRGVERIPHPLRDRGVTVREFEVLQLLVRRAGNRTIGERLHISPRTVEKHVASLIAKTGLADRGALSEYAAQVLE